MERYIINESVQSFTNGRPISFNVLCSNNGTIGTNVFTNGTIGETIGTNVSTNGTLGTNEANIKTHDRNDSGLKLLTTETTRYR